MKSTPYERRAGYLGYVAHELRNPLATALWCAELLGKLAPADRGGARGEKLAATARRAIGRLSRLLEDHLLAERLEAGDYPVHVSEVLLAEAVAEAAGRAAPGGGFAVEADPGLAVATDRSLLLRAVEAMAHGAGAEGAPVALAAEPVPGGALVRARGARLGPDALAAPVKGSPPDATGRALGLVAARAIAERLGGSLSLDDGALVLRIAAGTSP